MLRRHLWVFRTSLHRRWRRSIALKRTLCDSSVGQNLANSEQTSLKSFMPKPFDKIPQGGASWLKSFQPSVNMRLLSQLRKICPIFVDPCLSIWRNHQAHQHASKLYIHSKQTKNSRWQITSTYVGDIDITSITKTKKQKQKLKIKCTQPAKFEKSSCFGPTTRIIPMRTQFFIGSDR